MPKYQANIDMNGNRIVNCKTIESLEKKVAELEARIQEQPKKDYSPVNVNKATVGIAKI